MVYPPLIFSVGMSLLLASAIIIGTPEHTTVRDSVKIFAYSGIFSVTSVVFTVLVYVHVAFSH